MKNLVLLLSVSMFSGYIFYPSNSRVASVKKLDEIKKIAPFPIKKKESANQNFQNEKNQNTSISTENELKKENKNSLARPDAVVRDKPIFVHFWGNQGEGILNTTQKTHSEERYMLSQPQFRDLAPFYAYDHTPEQKEIDTWVKINNQKMVVGKKMVEVTVNYHVTDEIMDQMIEYTVMAGLQGFNFLWYPGDATLKVGREAFVRNPNKRGLKLCYQLGDFGEGVQNYPSNSTYTESVNTIANHMQQPYYQRIDGKPVLSVLCFNHNLLDQNWINAKMLDINRIKAAAGIPELYLILVCDDYERNDWMQNNGFSAMSSYYLYGNYLNNNFEEVRTISQGWNQSNKLAGRATAPSIILGLDQRAREWHYSGGTEIISRYYTWQSCYEVLPKIIDDTINWLDNNPTSRIGFVNHADENTEQGISFFPRKLANGTIDATIVNIFKSKLNPNYNPN